MDSRIGAGLTMAGIFLVGSCYLPRTQYLKIMYRALQLLLFYLFFSLVFSPRAFSVSLFFF